MHLHRPLPLRRDIVASLLALCLWGASSALQASSAQPVFDLVQLMQTLAQVKSGHAVFTERRSSALLDRPLELSGRLSFEAPDTFTRETFKPRPERMAVVGNQLTMSMGSRSKTVAIESVPEAGIIIEAIRGTLTGNRQALENHFGSTVCGTAKDWSLELTPRDVRLREHISSVRLAGKQSAVHEVTINLADGDRSVMTIEPQVAEPKPSHASR